MSDEKKLMTAEQLGELCYPVGPNSKGLSRRRPEGFEPSTVLERIVADDLRRAVKCAKRLQTFLNRARVARAARYWT